jgi:hypothetical protein
MQLDIDKEVALRQRMTVGQLREKSEETRGDPTNTRNKQWLVKRIAWKMQANIEGDISQRARRRAAELACGTDIRTTAPKAIKPVPKPAGDTVTEFVPPEKDNRLPPPRSEIERVYKGEKIVVLVLDNGFEYEGRSKGRSALWPRSSQASTSTDTTSSSSTKKAMKNEQGQHQSPIELCDLHPLFQRRRARQGL